MYIKVIGTTGLGLAVLNILGFMKGVIMRKFNFRKILSLALAAFVAFGTFAVGAVGVNAETENWGIDGEDSFWAGSTSWFNVYDSGNDTPGTITSATSSNNKVFSIQKETFGGNTDFFMKGVGAGTAVLTVNFTTPSGETKTLTKSVLVKKYPKEIKSLKVNGKKVNTSKYKFYYNKKISKSKTKVNVKMALKKGWKIIGVTAERTKDRKTWKKFTVKKSALTKGKPIKFGKKYKDMYIYIELKKGNDIIWYSLDFYR